MAGDPRVRSFQLPWRSARGPGWDSALVDQWESLRDPLAVLSCCPGSFAPVRHPKGGSAVELRTVQPHLIVSVAASETGMPRQDFGPVAPGGSRGLLVSGGFQFSAGELSERLEQVSKVMVGDERVRALQLFTHRWNVRVPWTVTLFHLYERDNPAGGHSFTGDFRGHPVAARLTGCSPGATARCGSSSTVPPRDLARRAPWPRSSGSSRRYSCHL